MKREQLDPEEDKKLDALRLLMLEKAAERKRQQAMKKKWRFT